MTDKQAVKVIIALKSVYEDGDDGRQIIAEALDILLKPFCNNADINAVLIDKNELIRRIDEEREYLKARDMTGAEHILTKYLRDIVETAPYEYPYNLEAFR